MTPDQQQLYAVGGDVLAPVDCEFVIARRFAAPRQLVFRAWTDQAHLPQWFSPVGFKTQLHRFDMRPGGVILYEMHNAAGFQMWGRWTMREVAAPERLVYVASFSDSEGGLTRAPFSETWPLETLSTLIFEEQDGATMLLMRAIPINASEAECQTFRYGHGSMQMGWGGTLDKLDAYLAQA